MDLTPDNVFGLLRSTDEFPVDFDDAWRWIGYSTKGNAKRLLEEDFEKDLDYEIPSEQGGQVFIKNDKNPKGGRPVVEIRMTVACFKEFCMAARTPEGKEVRRYFRRCEEQLKAIYAAQVPEPVSTLDQEWSMWQQRYDIRIDLKDRLRPALMSLTAQWAEANAQSPITLCSAVHDAMNERIQGIKSQVIKDRTGLSVTELIRDYFGTEPLAVYSAINKLSINFVVDEGMEPLEAVHRACDVFLSLSYQPKPVPMLENLYSQGGRLKAARKRRQLQKPQQLDLFGLLGEAS